MNMTYSVTTNTSRIVEATWTGRAIQLAVYGALWSDVQLEWHARLEMAVERFQWLIEHNSKPVKETPQITLIAEKETQLQRLALWDDFDEYDDQYRDGRNPDDKEYTSRVQDTY